MGLEEIDAFDGKRIWIALFDGMHECRYFYHYVGFRIWIAVL